MKETQVYKMTFNNSRVNKICGINKTLIDQGISTILFDCIDDTNIRSIIFQYTFNKKQKQFVNYIICQIAHKGTTVTRIA